MEYPINALARTASVLTTLLTRLVRIVIDFTHGSSAYGVSRELMMQRAELEQIFLSMLIGEQLGLPVYSSYYARRLFPYLLPRLAGWKRSLARPRGVGGW